MTWDLIVVGGGAAGFYGAIQAAAMAPAMSILIVEKTSRVLTKVSISGGGRCNVTHNCPNPFELARHYPRGARALKKLFKVHDMSHVVTWFASHGVVLKTEDDGRMFPSSDQSRTIVDCFLREARRLQIEVRTNEEVVRVVPEGEGHRVHIRGGKSFHGTYILVAMGGNKYASAYQWLVEAGHRIETPRPSLFTFNDRDKAFADLMGVSMPAAQVKIAGTSYVENGPVLITHWGLSGPAVIKLSAWAASYLYDVEYRFDVMVSWIGPVEEDSVRDTLREARSRFARQQVKSRGLFSIPLRLWRRLCERAGIEEEQSWQATSQKSMNRLVESIIRCPFRIQGKTTFKEEFVTCGGVPLDEVDLTTMESKIKRNLFFAGEVLDIDGETGGFNFQSAWTTSFVAARAISARSC